MGLFGKKKQSAGDGSPMSDSDLEVLAANGDEEAMNTLAATREGFSDVLSAWANAANGSAARLGVRLVRQPNWLLWS